MHRGGCENDALRLMPRTVRIAENAQYIAGGRKLQLAFQLREQACWRNAVFIGHCIFRLITDSLTLFLRQLALALFLGAAFSMASRTDVISVSSEPIKPSRLEALPASSSERARSACN